MPPDPKRTTEIEAFWRDAIEAVPGLDPNAAFTIFSFGDNPELSEHVLAETLAGRNRATASLRWRYEATLSKAGDVAIATGWTGRPRAVLVTRQVDVVPYRAVDEEFARAEGYATDPLDGMARSALELLQPPLRGAWTHRVARHAGRVRAV